MRLIFILFTCLTFGQEKPIVFYNENGEEITKEDFIKNKDYSKNLDLYFENDTIQIALLVTQKKMGKLDKNTFKNLKLYLSELADREIDSTQNMVINYLTLYPKKNENTKPKSGWNVLDRDYLKKLHRIANINQFWIHSPECDNLEYFHQKTINWIEDKDNLLKKLFFSYENRYGSYLLIKPDGRFYYYLGEHSKYQIWKDARKYFKKK